MNLLVFVVVGGAIVGAVLLLRRRFGNPFAGGDEFLCDTCRYSNARDCNRPERPNARKCPDYKRR